MGLAHPALNTYKKSKQTKYKSAEHAKKAREAEALQIAMYKKWSIKQGTKETPSKKDFVPNYTYRDADNKPASVQFSGGICSRKEDRQYTGTLIKGIATMHKSNAVPIIDEQQATEIARMRRG